MIFANKYYLFIFLILILSSCKKTREEYDVTETQILKIKTYKELHFVPDERHLNGKLLLTDIHGKELDYDVENWNNSINVPFGFYKAKVYGFEGYAYTSFDLIATGGNREVNNSCRLSKLPTFNVEIDHFIISYNRYCALINLDSTDGQWIFSIWGTNEEDPEEDQIEHIRNDSNNISVGTYDDGFYYVYLEPIDGVSYKYYSITAEPWWGKWDTRVHHWSELIID